MLYLLDASVLITAHNTYYPIDQIPEFWDWLLFQAENNVIKIPLEILEEIEDGRKDPLLDWISDATNRDKLLLKEEVDLAHLRYVVYTGYANDLTDDEVEALGRDPFLIAYAKVSADRCVVTKEISQPSKQRQNKKIPDVCNVLGISWCDPFTLNRTLGFRTSWRT